MSSSASLEIRVGPLLRYVDDDRATVWLETSASCEVSILGRSTRTFHVAGHHYALVILDGLGAGSSHPYDVRLDGHVAWPPEGWPYPRSLIRTLPKGPRLRLAFGSCRVAGPRQAPLGLDRILRRYDPDLDALSAFADRARLADPETWPDVLLLLGDQVYADDIPEATREAMRRRRGPAADVGRAVEDFEDYTALYRDSLTEDPVRWLLSTIPTAMMFDDHELVDDWDISAMWLAEMRSTPGWDERLAGGLMSYWLYQHLGNLSPEGLEADELYRQVRGEPDGAPRLRSFIRSAHDDRRGFRWAYRRDLGEVRLLVIDARAARVLEEGHRDILDPEAWQWLEANVEGAGHLVLASSVPVIYAQGFHDIQAWSERVAGGAWGAFAARLAERLRRALSLSGWPAFEASFDRLMRLIDAISEGQHGPRPSSITLLGGDVHHGYVARVEAFIGSASLTTPIHQVVTSPFRHPLWPHERLAQRVAASRLGGWALRRLAAAAGAPPAPARWRRLEGPDFSNQISTLEFDGSRLDLLTEAVVHRRRSAGTELRALWRRALDRSPAHGVETATANVETGDRERR